MTGMPSLVLFRPDCHSTSAAAQGRTSPSWSTSSQTQSFLHEAEDAAAEQSLAPHSTAVQLSDLQRSRTLCSRIQRKVLLPCTRPAGLVQATVLPRLCLNIHGHQLPTSEAATWHKGVVIERGRPTVTRGQAATGRAAPEAQTPTPTVMRRRTGWAQRLKVKGIKPPQQLLICVQIARLTRSAHWRPQNTPGMGP
jgi:hypothetical protein